MQQLIKYKDSLNLIECKDNICNNKALKILMEKLVDEEIL